MESQSKPGFDGTQGVATSAPMTSPMRLTGLILRAVAVVLTIIATIVMGVAKQTATTVVVDPNSGDLVTLTGTAKSTYSAALVYFIIVNTIVFVYSSVSLATSITTRGGGPGGLVIAVGDLMMVVLLFSGNGAAAAISIVSEHGQARLGWDKICDVAGKFCDHVKASIVLSMFASLAYVVMLLLVIVGLHKRS